MKNKKKGKDRSPKSPSPGAYIQKDTLHTILGVTSVVAALFLLLSAFNVGGPVGSLLFKLLKYLFGIGYYILPFVFIILAISLFQPKERNFAVPQFAGALVLFFSGLGMVSLLFPLQGGKLGGLLARPLFSLFGLYVSLIILIALIVISFLVIFDTAIKLDLLYLWKKTSDKKKGENTLVPMEALAIDKAVEKIGGIELTKDDPRVTERAPKKLFKDESETFVPMVTKRSGKAWTPPPLSLLERDRGKPGVGDIKANANLIKRTMQNFGIVVEMDEISIGPSVTRYALKPAEGVKLSKILGLQNNLELALAAHPVRIEAPIPGKSLVGIEVPNTAKSTIGLGSLLDEDGYKVDKPLLVALGRDISGNSHFENLGKMPHLLIAGATGSGKSVTIHAIINSLIFRNPPENLKFIMIDPKRVELTLYNNIPHLLTPVVTDPKKAILSLKWATKEMERRYEMLEKESVRDIDSYHKNVFLPKLKKAAEDEALDPMPYIVVVIDELADLMQSYPRELEAAVVRLAQMSRAVGIHLILSTQRPSVNIITGLIKANVPARIALQVSSQIDSRTILDTAGAEKLLGAGDMLYLSGDMGKPKRIQSAFISEKEVKDVSKYLRDTYKDELQNEINLSDAAVSPNAIFSADFESDDLGDDDELYEEARETVLQAGKASTSFLQRKLKVGYARAARLIDLLEERGVVGPGSGAKPREVIGAQSNEGFGESEDQTLV